MVFCEKKYFRQYLAANTASLILFVMAGWVAWPSSSIQKLSQQYEDKEGIGLRLNGQEITWMVSLLDLGNAFSPIFAGYIMNSIGRKNTLLITSVFLLPTWLLVLDSTLLIYIYIARFLIGLAKGLAFTTIPVYISEISDQNIRGSLGSSVHSYMSMGLLFSLGVGPYITYVHLNVILSIIPIIFLLLFMFMPESPYYYIMKHDYIEAEKSLQYYRHYSLDVSSELKLMIDNHHLINNNININKIIKNETTRTPLIIINVISFFQRLSGITALIAYSSSTLPKLSFTWFGPSECVTLFTLLMVISNLAFCSYIDKVGRRVLLCSSIFFATIITFLTSIYYYVYPFGSGDYYDLIPYILIISYSISYFGIGNITPILPSEYFSTSLRGFASATASVSLALGSFITSKFYLVIKDMIGVYFIFLIFTLINIMYLIFSYMYVIETRGKSFEQIQTLFYKKKKNKEINASTATILQQHLP